MTITLTLTCSRAAIRQPVVAVKVATQRLKPLRGGERDENDDVNDNENREAEQNKNC